MAVPFGFSFGDFVAGISLVRDIIDALQATSSSTARYHGLISELFALERALLEVKKLSLDDEEVPPSYRLGAEALISGLQRTAIECQSTIDRLLVKVKKYEGHLSSNGSGSKWKDALRKVQWALLTDQDLEVSRAEIRGHSSSINMLLVIVQFEMMRMQQQKANSDRTSLVQWLQQGYMDSMTSLGNALAGIGRQSNKLLEAAGYIVSMNNQIFEKVIQIHQYVSTPRTLEYGEPIYFVDAFGQQTRFHLDYVYSADVLEDWLKRRFHEIGYEKILGGEFALQDIKTKREISISREWQTQLYPGMSLGMDMIYNRHPNKLNICPGCQIEVPGALDEDVECPNCRVHFRRIDEILDLNDSNAIIAKNNQLELSQQRISQARQMRTGQDHYRRQPSALENWAYRMCLEKQQMQAFRRFRFQPTRLEFDLASVPAAITRFKLLVVGLPDPRPMVD